MRLKKATCVELYSPAAQAYTDLQKKPLMSPQFPNRSRFMQRQNFAAKNMCGDFPTRSARISCDVAMFTAITRVCDLMQSSTGLYSKPTSTRWYRSRAMGNNRDR